MQIINPNVAAPVTLPNDTTAVDALNAGFTGGVNKLNAEAYGQSVKSAEAAQRAAAMKPYVDAIVASISDPAEMAKLLSEDLTDKSVAEATLNDVADAITAYFNTLGISNPKQTARAYISNRVTASKVLTPEQLAKFYSYFPLGDDSSEVDTEAGTEATQQATQQAAPQVTQQATTNKATGSAGGTSKAAPAAPGGVAQKGMVAPKPEQTDEQTQLAIAKLTTYAASHPELFKGITDPNEIAKILNGLKTTNPDEYNKAMSWIKSAVADSSDMAELQWVFNNAPVQLVQGAFRTVPADTKNWHDSLKNFWASAPKSVIEGYMNSHGGALPPSLDPVRAQQLGLIQDEAAKAQAAAAKAEAEAAKAQAAAEAKARAQAAAERVATNNPTTSARAGSPQNAVPQPDGTPASKSTISPRAAARGIVVTPKTGQTTAPAPAATNPADSSATPADATLQTPTSALPSVKVQSGDTLSGIVRNYLQANNIKLPPSIPFETYVGMVAIASGIKNPNQIKVDDIIKFPPVPQEKEQPTPKPSGVNVSRSDLITSDAGTFLGISPADWAKASKANEEYFLSNANKAIDASQKADFAREKGNTDAAAALDAKATQAAANVIVQPHTKAAAEAFYRKVSKMTSAQLYAAGYTALGDKKLEVEKLELEKGKQATEEKKALQDIEESKARAAYYYATAATAGSGGGNVTSLKQQYTSVKSLADMEARFLSTRQVGKDTVNYLAVLAQQDAPPVSQDIANSYAKYLYYNTGEVVPFKEVHNLLGRPKGFVIDKDKRGKLSQDEQFQLLSKLGLVVNGVPIPSLPAITSLLPGVGDGSGGSSQSTQDSSMNALLNEIFGAKQ